MRTLRDNRRRALVLAVTAAAALAAALGIAAGAGAGQTIVLGQTAAKPKPSCPADAVNDCQAVGKVTGFQVAAAGEKNIFRAPVSGQIVKWDIYLSHPKTTAPAGKTSEYKFFNDFYGTPPKAGIAILRKRHSKKKPRPQYKLVRQSPIQNLTEPIAESTHKKWTTFQVDPPLAIKKGDIVGLTIPTWAPAFAINLPSKNVWRASRAPKRCNGASNIKQGHAHTKVGQFRVYGCLYKSARLLYQATLVAG